MSEITVSNTFSELIAPIDPEIEAMLKAGVHLGHSKRKNHPAMKPYIFGVRNTISIIDVVKTKEKMASALEFLKGVVSRAGLILFVGTRPAARQVIREVAEKAHMPYFVERWIGGTLTNFKMIRRRVEYMEQLEHERASGGFEKYTKKERLMKDEEIARLVRNFDGIRVLKRIPDAVFIVDITHDSTAIQETRRMNIPVVALVDTNADVKLVDRVIPSNDDALPAIHYMLGRIADAIKEGQQHAEKIAEPV